MVVMFTATSDTTDTVSGTIEDTFSWINRNYSVLLESLIIIITAYVVVRIVQSIFSRVLGKTMREDMFPTKTDRDRRLRTLNSISNALISFIIWAVAFIALLNIIGINTAPILASAGILSVAIGFGAQSLVRDFVTGMFIIAENQYRVGDYVEIGSVKGTVKSVTMRTTVVQDDDGSVFYIPNGSIVVTGNHTMNNNKVSIELTASTETPIDVLQKVINSTGTLQAESETMKDNIVEPLQFKRIKDIKSGIVVIRVSGRVKAGMQIAVKSDYYIHLQKALLKNKIALK
jgi:small conductance mechanosensitive channel